MVMNGKSLLHLAPIINMETSKKTHKGISYGLSEAGYDIRLKQDITFDPSGPGHPSIHVDDKYNEGRFILASAIEEFNVPTNLVGIVHDKSTLARQGLSVFNTVIEPGQKGFITLELVFHGNMPLKLYAGQGIAQVIFHRLHEEANYSGKYQNQADGPVSAILED